MSFKVRLQRAFSSRLAPKLPSKNHKPTLSEDQAESPDGVDIGKQVHIAGRTGPELRASWTTKLSAGLAVGGSLGLLLKAGVAVALSANPIPLAAAVLGTAVASYVGADFIGGIVHHAIDNYAKPGEGVMGTLASDYTAHHYFGHSNHQQEAVENTNPYVKVLGPALAGLALSPVGPFLGVAAAVSLGGSLTGLLSHRFAHDKKPSKAVRLLQKMGILQTEENHASHHRMPFSDSYTPVNGCLNPLLDGTHFWRKWEKGIYKLTGAEPKTWHHPPTRDFALGKIDKDEYQARYDDEIPMYMANVDFKGERERMKSYLHGKFDGQ